MTSDIINKLLIYSELNAKSFSEKIGLERPQAIYDILKGKTKSISLAMQDKILSVFPELNRTWLLTGEGEMLKGESQGSGDGTSGSGDKITIPLSAWNVIEKQAESLAARDRQMELLMKSRDEQINQLISTVRREIADLKKTYVHTEAATFADAG